VFWDGVRFLRVGQFANQLRPFGAGQPTCRTEYFNEGHGILHTDGVSLMGLYPSRRRSAARERRVKQFTQVAAPSARPHAAKIFRARLRREHEESLKTKKGKE